MKLTNRHILLILSILLISISVKAQKAEIKFHEKNIDKGDIEDWNTDAFVFEYTNTGTNPLVLLKATKQPGIRIIFNRRYLNPGETDSIKIFVVPKKTGKFSKEIEVFSNASFDSHIIKIKGNITSIDNCPGTISPEKRNERLIVVINKYTKKPIANAQLQILYNERVKMKEHSNKKGRVEKSLKPGLYMVNITAKNYYPLEESFYLDAKTSLLIFEMIPIEEIAEIPDKPEIIPKETKIEEPEVKKPEIIEKTIEEPEYDEPEVFESKPDPVEPVDKDTIIEDPDTPMPRHKYASNNLVFLIDVSTSMKSRSKLKLLKISVKDLVDILRNIDNVSLISYASSSKVLIHSVEGDKHDTIINVVDELKAYGSTHGISGLSKAYELAWDNYKSDGNNQVIIATDGQFNSPDFSEKKLLTLIQDNALKGVSLTIIGFGNNSQSRSRMTKMAKIGMGNYLHISDESSVNQILIDEIKKNSLKH